MFAACKVFLALVRYHWSQHRSIFLLCAGIVILMRLGYALGMPNEIVTVLLWPCAAPLLLLFYNDDEASGPARKLRLSPHLFRLPISSFQLFASLSLYNALAGVVWAMAMVLALPKLLPLSGIVAFVLFTISLILAVQAVCWSFGRIHALAAVIAGSLVITGLSMNAMHYGWPFLAFVAPLALGASWLALVTDRNGMSLLKQGYVVPWGAGRTKPFRSARHAQLWFEWRRREFLIPWAVMLTGAGFVIAALVTGKDDIDTAAPLLILTLFAATFFSMFRYALAVDSTRGSYATFVYTRPVDDGVLARWQLDGAFAGAAATLAALAITALLTFAIVAINYCGAEFGRLPSIALVVMFLLGLVTAALFLWLAYASGVFAPLVFWFAGVSLLLVSERGTAHSPYALLFIFCALVGALIALWTLFRAHRRGLLLVRPLWLALLWTGCTAVLFLSGLTPSHSLDNATPDGLALLALAMGAVSLIAILPAASIPLTLAWRRHRASSRLFDKIAEIAS